jgi:parvulin-like peptidyl-prolyl isomerase
MRTKAEIDLALREWKHKWLQASFALTLFGLLATVGLLSCQRQKPPEDIIVRVGSEVLTLTDIASDIPNQLRHRITKEELQNYVVRWINSQILFQEAKRRKLDQRIDVQREIRRLERELVVNVLLDQEINKQFSATEQEIRIYYSENRESFARRANEIHVWYIKANSQKTADSLYTELRRAGDFARAANQFANRDSSAWNLYLTEEETPPAIAKQIFTLMVGAVSRPIQLDDGFHLFKIIEKLPASTFRPLSQVRDEIIAKIQTEKRQDRYKQLLAELKANSVIETNFQMIESLPVDSIMARATR